MNLNAGAMQPEKNLTDIPLQKSISSQEKTYVELVRPPEKKNSSIYWKVITTMMDWAYNVGDVIRYILYDLCENQ